jgi:hypothetical protein
MVSTDSRGALYQRFQSNRDTIVCFVCSLPNHSTLGFVTLGCSWDSHSRRVHEFCWKLVLRMAQTQIDRQQSEP